MRRIEGQAVRVTALDGHALAARPVEGVGLDRVTGCTKGAQAIHRREGRAALLDGHDVIDVFGHDLAASVFARLTERGFRQLGLAEPLPPGSCVGPVSHG